MAEDRGLVVFSGALLRRYYFLITGSKFLRRHTTGDVSCPVLTDQQQIPTTSR